MSIRCLLGWHADRFVGFRWVDTQPPGSKEGWDHVCDRCGRTIYLGAGGTA